MRDKIRVLFLSADPFGDGAPLRLHEEVRPIREALRRVRARGEMELVPYHAARTRDLREALLRHDPRIVHFAGRDAVIYLADADGRRGVVGKDALAQLFGILSEWIKVVILNGRDTLPIVEALAEVVDYAIGMDQPLGDAAAVVFASGFYGGLRMGKTVQASFDLAVRRLERQGSAASAIPVLRIRPGVDPAAPLACDRPMDTCAGRG